MKIEEFIKRLKEFKLEYSGTDDLKFVEGQADALKKFKEFIDKLAGGK